MKVTILGYQSEAPGGGYKQDDWIKLSKKKFYENNNYENNNYKEPKVRIN